MTLEAMIDQLSRDEQLIAMELLWKRMTQHANPMAPPEWHRDVAARRVAAVENGEDTLSDWSDARKRLADRLR
ncbi:MAG: addiction module protein [Planctomycetales bacterium]|nr:addiction module protein [Planctomycetales bacterium]